MMRFGLVHRVMTDLLAVLGVLALVTSGELGRAISLAILLSLAGALVVPEAWQSHPMMGRFATVAPVGILAVQLARLAWGAPLLQTAVEFAVALQIIRLATRRGAAQDQQVIVLAWLHLIAGTVLGGGLSYALCLAGFLVVAPGALVLSHLRREVEGNYRQGARDRTGLPVDVPRILRSRRVVGKTFLAITCLLSIPIFLFTATVFVLFPRVGLSLILLNRPGTGRMIGFSDHVDLGGVGTLRSDPTIVLRVEPPKTEDPPPMRLTMYLRGTALDTYDGRAWGRSSRTRVPAMRMGSTIPIERPPVPAQDPVMRMELEAIEPPVIFLPNDAVAMRIRPRGEPLFGGALEVIRGSEGEFQYSGPDQRGIVYEVYLASKNEKFSQVLPERDRTRYLLVPKLTPRVVQLASEWAGAAPGPLDKARAIEQRLRTGYGYDLTSPSGGSPDPLDHFLFESKRGHCEYFSTAMAILLRVAGVPTRNVTGFVGGTYNRFGHYYSVREGDAHSWVEAWIDGAGWRRFDPTPPSGAQPLADSAGMLATIRDMLEAVSRTWDHRVVRYDLQQQIWLFGGMRLRAAHATTSFKAFSVKVSNNRASAVVLVVLIAGATAFGFWVWLRRRTARAAKGKQKPTEAARRAREATQLYEALDAAMTAVGIGRTPGVPPLKHANAVTLAGHPQAPDVAAVTDRYLRARFGNEPLEREERGALDLRIQRVRMKRTESHFRIVR
jgi:protein-glutamine gamma-glutamyltransferase